MNPSPELPIDVLESDFYRALEAGSILLEAEPGAGKSTRVPLWALEASGEAEVWLIQPRVLPTRALAQQLAHLLGEKSVGQRVGYQVPFDRQSSAATRLLVMTPGILLQRLLSDPELCSVRVVILDEIHERTATQDLVWALLQEAAILRDDLRLVLMSATPEKSLQDQVDTCLYTPGRCFPVTVDYLPALEQRGQSEPLAQHLLRACQTLPDWQQQTLLVFLPGWREIEACRKTLNDAWPAQQVYCLHSRVAPAEQARALNTSSGPRIILATNIAETSLTIADVTVVIDSGLERTPEFEQGTGVSRLYTRRISAASAEQRRGRAGRVQAGHCVRLWPAAERLAPAQLPEIRRSDYLPLALWVAHWGSPWRELPWLEKPGEQGMEQALQQLTRWQLVTDDEQVTERGRQVAALGTHPRLAALLLHTRENLTDNAWLPLAALALHFDWQEQMAAGATAWLESALGEFRRTSTWQQLWRRWQKVLAVTLEPSASLPDPLSAALVQQVAEVMPERLAHRQTSGRYRLNSGISVTAEGGGEWLLMLQLLGRRREHSGVGVPVELPPQLLESLAQARRTLHWQGGRWVCTTGFYLGGRCVREQREKLSSEQIVAELIANLQQQGLAHIHWPAPAVTLLARLRLAASHTRLTLPDCSLTLLEENLSQWLQPLLETDTAPEQLPLAQGLKNYVGYEAMMALDRLLPERLTLPSGRKVAINYADSLSAALTEEPPVPRVAAKLQEFFGTQEVTLPLPQVPLQLELLSPAGRALAVTGDLAFFWREVYPQVRRENRGRYARHPWPDDPLTHTPTAYTKKRLPDVR